MNCLNPSGTFRAGARRQLINKSLPDGGGKERKGDGSWGERGGADPGGTIASPLSPLIRWGIVADPELWRYRCKKLWMERRGERGRYGP